MNRLYKIVVLCVFLSFFCTFVFAEVNKIRVGYFPNITHAQAIIGIANGSFQKSLGTGVTIEAKQFNAGPSAIEALVTGAIDITYVGPNPAINGYVRSQGKALKIIAGAASGGAALIVRADAGINKISDFHGKKIASPQLGNTQDVALRNWLKNNGLKLREKSGDVQVMPIQNPDQLTLFLKKEIDGAWTIEPWASRLILEGNGKLFLDERTLWKDGKFVTTHIVVSPTFARNNPNLLKKWISAHVDVTNWINTNKEEAKKVINSELKRLTGKALPDNVLNESFKRLDITYDPIQTSLYENAKSAFAVGLLGTQQPDLTSIYDLSILNSVLKEKNLNPIQ